jgi:hypothetical protein
VETTVFIGTTVGTGTKDNHNHESLPTCILAEMHEATEGECREILSEEYPGWSIASGRLIFPIVVDGIAFDVTVVWQNREELFLRKKLLHPTTNMIETNTSSSYHRDTNRTRTFGI